MLHPSYPHSKTPAPTIHTWRCAVYSRYYSEVGKINTRYTSHKEETCSLIIHNHYLYKTLDNVYGISCIIN